MSVRLLSELPLLAECRFDLKTIVHSSRDDARSLGLPQIGQGNLLNTRFPTLQNSQTTSPGCLLMTCTDWIPFLSELQSCFALIHTTDPHQSVLTAPTPTCQVLFDYPLGSLCFTLFAPSQPRSIRKDTHSFSSPCSTLLHFATFCSVYYNSTPIHLRFTMSRSECHHDLL